MRRIVVVGGTGFFGARIAERLPGSLVAARRRGDLQFDVEDPDAIRRSLRSGDVVVDAAGPFQLRSTRLLEAAIDLRFDLVDLSDAPSYCAAVYQREAEIESAGIRVLTACSSLSTVTAAAIESSGIGQPRRVSVQLVPASHYTANRATARSMLEAIRAGATPTPGGLSLASVDAVTLPRVWPSLDEARFIVDAGIPGIDALLRVAVRYRSIARGLESAEPVLLPLLRLFGRRTGRITYEVDARFRMTITGRNSYVAAVVPAVLAVRSLVAGQFDGVGVIPPNRHVDRSKLFEALVQGGVEISRGEGAPLPGRP